MRRPSEQLCLQTRSRNSRSGPTPTKSLRFLPTSRIGSTAGCATTLSQVNSQSQNLMQDNSVPAKLVLVTGLLFIVISSVAVLSPARGIETAGQKPLDPTVWGKDHVGRP